MKDRYVFTTPIYYVNSKPHVGHAYTSVATDVLCRFHKLIGKTSFMFTGTDEHGSKVKQSADLSGVEPQDFVDQISDKFRHLSDSFNIDYSSFLRTTSKAHKQAVVAIWNLLLSNGDIYLDKYSGWYSIRDETFYKPEDLIDGKAPTGAPVTWVEEDSYFFRLSKYGDRLLEFYSNNPDFIIPKTKFNELVSFLESGLQDISISRLTCQWGIKVPNNPQHTIYVWLDALTVYLTACGFPDNSTWGNSYVNHVVGKDILRFHGVYWLAFLMSANFEMPSRIFVHGWWTRKKAKMSKSLGNVVSPSVIIDKYGMEPFRYFLLKEIKFGNDGDFNEESILNRVNADLANNIGNLLKRVMTVFWKKFDDGSLPFGLNIEDDFLNRGEACVARYISDVENCRFQDALDNVISLSAFANEFVNKNRIWDLTGDKVRDVLGGVVLLLRIIAICLQPFLPKASSVMLDVLSVKHNQRSLSDFDIKELRNFEARFMIKDIPIIFPRLVDQ